MNNEELLDLREFNSSDKGSFIGYGINIMKASGPYADQLKRPVLKIKKVSEKLVKRLPVYEGVVHHQSSNGLKEIYSDWSINASAEVKTPFFSGNFKAEYSNKSRHNHCNKFFKGIVSIKGYSYSLSLPEASPVNREALVDYLIENGYVDEVALTNIRKTMNPKRLFDTYGTHVVVGGLNGGCIQITAQYSNDTAVSEQKFSSTLEFACGFATGKSSGGFNKEQKSILENTILFANSRGGDPRIIGTLTNFDEIPETFKKWSASVDDKNYVLADITDAIPIWDFCDNEKRKEALLGIYNNSCTEQFRSIEMYFPSPKNIEKVVVYLAANRNFKLTKDSEEFAIISEQTPLILVKELISEGSDIYRFKLLNPTTEKAYLCVSAHGPYGDFISLAFTGDKESEYAKFYLERDTKYPNSYFFKAIKTSRYVTLMRAPGGYHLVARELTTKSAKSFTLFTYENESI